MKPLQLFGLLGLLCVPIAPLTAQYSSPPGATISGTPTAGNCASWLTATTLQDAGSVCGGGGGGGAFSTITAGTNTAALVMGTGGSLTVSGTGSINATKINGTALSGLATGILKNTTATGVPSIAGSADILAACTTCVVASSPGVGIAHFAGSTQTVTSSAVNLASADVTGILPAASTPAVSFPAPAASTTLSGNSEIFVCTTTCSGTVPVPAAGVQYCVMNDDNVATVITLGAIGSSARYENTARTAYGTAGTGTFISGGAVKDSVCIVGRDATHYLTVSFNGTWTAN